MIVATRPSRIAAAIHGFPHSSGNASQVRLPLVGDGDVQTVP